MLYAALVTPTKTFHTVSRDGLLKVLSRFDSLPKKVWQNRSLRLSTKFQVLRTVITPMPLYGAETWVRYRRQSILLLCFYERCLRTILGIK